MILIIGYGNPLRRDDGIGWMAAEALRQQSPPGVEILTEMQLFPEMAESLRHFSHVIFIDAAEGGRPGDIQYQPVQPEPLMDSSFTHHLTPAQLLALSALLYDHTIDGTLFTVVGQDFEHGEGLSPTLQAVFPALLSALYDHISR
ncbi:MAG: hydrogenase maturation protease [Anaerolineae bacterium]|jgi:hydrogenase maturation protease|nr:hydrogenase maturation protease [Anaerolineae bacterium]